MQTPLNEVFRQAFALDDRGDYRRARALYDQILRAVPDHPGALLRIARHLRREGDMTAARATLERALVSADAMSLPSAEIWAALGELHRSAGAYDDARAAYERALATAPEFAAALMGLGAVALDRGDPREAERRFRAVVAALPASPYGWVNLALALIHQGRLDEADEAVRMGMERRPRGSESRQIAATIAYRRGEYARSETLCREGLAQSPGHSAMSQLLAQSLEARGVLAEARALMVDVVGARPDDSEARVCLGRICLGLGNAVEAREHLEAAVAAGVDTAAVLANLGLARLNTGDLAGAIAVLEQGVGRGEREASTAASLTMALREACKWDRAEALEPQLLSLALDETVDSPCPPMVALYLPVTPRQALAVARHWSRRTLRPPVRKATTAARGPRLRVGYLSSNFHEHPMAHLMAGLFERHDRRRFEVFAYSAGRDDGSAIRRRVQAAFEHWVDVRAMADEQAADRIRADAIDVLVDTMGHTEGTRLAILGWRPAPVQVHYLGFPGTLGYDAVDAIVADGVVVPEGEESAFHEKVLRLPRCYFVNDDRRTLPEPAERGALGLADDAIVLASFNQPFKLTRRFFSFWMEALQRQPRAVLWLYAPRALTVEHLRAEAARSGIGDDRLVFAGRVSQTEHVARLRTADLALDVLPYGAHTTGSDALWAGVPLLSCRGSTFAGRVGASLLSAAGLSELVTESPEAYRAALLDLVVDPHRLRDYRRRLEAGRAGAPLFDTEGFTRDWERLLEAQAP